KAAGLGDQVDAVGGRPEAFLIGGGDLAVGSDADAVGGAEAVGDYFRLRAVTGDFEQRAMLGNDGVERVAGGLGVVKIALSVGLQTHGEFVEMLGHLCVIVDALIEVDFAVAVEIMKAGELVAAEDVYLRFWAA